MLKPFLSQHKYVHVTKHKLSNITTHAAYALDFSGKEFDSKYFLSFLLPALQLTACCRAIRMFNSL